jgi:mRNA interferase HigB
MSIRIIKESRLHESAKQHSRAASRLDRWRTTVRSASWKTFADVKQTFGSSAYQVTVPNGRQVVVFNIGGGAFHLITAIHFNRGIVYIRKFMTHAEYSKGDWKNDP